MNVSRTVGCISYWKNKQEMRRRRPTQDPTNRRKPLGRRQKACFRRDGGNIRIFTRESWELGYGSELAAGEFESAGTVSSGDFTQVAIWSWILLAGRGLNAAGYASPKLRVLKTEAYQGPFASNLIIRDGKHEIQAWNPSLALFSCSRDITFFGSRVHICIKFEINIMGVPQRRKVLLPL